MRSVIVLRGSDQTWPRCEPMRRLLLVLMSVGVSAAVPDCLGTANSIAHCSEKQIAAMSADEREESVYELERRIFFKETKHKGVTINVDRKRKDLERTIEALRAAHRRLDRCLARQPETCSGGMGSHAFAEQMLRVHALQEKTERFHLLPLIPPRGTPRELPKRR